MSIQEQITELVDKYESLDARRLKRFNEENTKKADSEAVVAFNGGVKKLLLSFAHPEKIR